MSENIKNYTKIKLEVISPLCIGNGQILSPYTDYVLDENAGKLYYINKAKINRQLAANDKLMDTYVYSVANNMDASNTRSEFNFRQFIESSLRMNLVDCSFRVIDSRVVGQKQIYQIIKNADAKAYVPGSSLKGAIKSALLSEYCHSSEGEQLCKNILNSSTVKDISSFVEPKLDKWAKIGVTDSLTFADKTLGSIETKRLHFRKGDLQIPQVWECIQPGATTEIQLTTTKEENWKNIFELINNYAYELNRFEWNVLGNFEEKISNKLYDSIYDFHEDLEEKINNVNSNECYLRLGIGKGYYMNSIGVALFNADPSGEKYKFKKILELYQYHKIRNKTVDLDPYEFPITKVIDSIHQQPIGWVKLTAI